MTSLPIDKIMEALASSSSTNYVEENTLTSLEKKQDVISALEQLIKDRKIFCCMISKDGRTFNAYWLPFHVAQSKRKQHSAHFSLGEKNKPRPEVKPRKPTIKQTSSRTSPTEKTLPDRWCRACEMKHQAKEFANSRSRRCISSSLLYQQNKPEILLEKARKWREKKKAAQVNKTITTKGNKAFNFKAPSSPT